MTGKYKHIIVWECTFCKVDDDGNTLLNEDGTVKQFDAPKMDWSHIAEYVEHDDLVELEDYCYPDELNRDLENLKRKTK